MWKSLKASALRTNTHDICEDTFLKKTNKQHILLSDKFPFFWYVDAYPSKKGTKLAK